MLSGSAHIEDECFAALAKGGRAQNQLDRFPATDMK